MQIPAEIKAKSIRSVNNTAAREIHVKFEEDVLIDAGSTLVINPLNPKIIEIRKIGAAPLFRPYYLEEE